MSKTAGTAVTLDEAIERHGPDALRYFLLREVGFEADGNFSWDRFDERYTADLADGLGNLVSRSLAMIAKYREGVVPPAQDDTTLDQAGRDAIQAYASAMDAYDLRGGAEAAWGLVGDRQSLHPAGGALEAGEGGSGRRAGCRARGAGARALPTGGVRRPVHPGEGGEHPAVAGCAASTRGSGLECSSAHPRSGARRPAGPRPFFPSPQASRS